MALAGSIYKTDLLTVRLEIVYQFNDLICRYVVGYACDHLAALSGHTCSYRVGNRREYDGSTFSVIDCFRGLGRRSGDGNHDVDFLALQVLKDGGKRRSITVGVLCHNFDLRIFLKTCDDRIPDLVERGVAHGLNDSDREFRLCGISSPVSESRQHCRHKNCYK